MVILLRPDCRLPRAVISCTLCEEALMLNPEKRSLHQRFWGRHVIATFVEHEQAKRRVFGVF